MLLEIGRKLFMTDEEYKSEVQEVSQDGFLRSIQFMKNRQKPD